MSASMESQLQQKLYEVSGKVNLFSKQDRGLLADKHWPDALAALQVPGVDFSTQKKVLDLGTGGGIPGLVLAEAVPICQFTLLDARQKKIAALQAVVDAVGFKNVECRSGRFEELGHDQEWREQFDIVLARAVASLPVLLEYAAGFAKTGGEFLAWKGPEWQEELRESEQAMAELGWEFVENYDYELLGGESRTILLFNKVGKTLGKYPRRTGVPSKRPL